MRSEHHHHPAKIRFVFAILAESFKCELQLQALVTDA